MEERQHRFAIKSFCRLPVAVCLLLFPVSAQSSGGIKGKIVDELGAAVAGAEVLLWDEPTRTERKTYSDGRGIYLFQGLAPGTYFMLVRNPGFSNNARTVTLDGSSSTVEADFLMVAASVVEEITVTASRVQRDVMDVPARAQGLSEEVLARENPTTTGDVLRQLPNVTTTVTGPYLVRPRLRGLDSSRIILMVDGERLNHSRSSVERQGAEIGLVDPGEVQSVEVVYGAGSALYGTDALSGIVNVVTHLPEPVDVPLRIGGSFQGHLSSNEIGRRGTGRLDAAGRKFAARGSLTLERYPNYHSGQPYGESSESITNRVTVFSDTPRSALTPPPGFVTQRVFGGVFANNFNAPYRRTSSEMINSQAHGSYVNVTARFFPSQRQSLRLRWDRRRTSSVGFPETAPPFFFQTITLPFSDLDKASLRYQVTGLASWFTRLSGSAYWQAQDRNLQNDIRTFSISRSDTNPNFDQLTQVDVLNQTRFDIKTFGFDAQGGFLWGAKQVTNVGVSHFRDHSRDTQFAVTDVTIIGNILRLPNATRRFFPVRVPVAVDALSFPVRVPVANYQNVGVFVEHEAEVARWMRVLAGFRVDRFDIESVPTPGYDPVLPGLEDADPPFDFTTLPPASGHTEINRTTYTGNVGFVFRPRPAVSLQARIGRSFRYPNLQELFFSGPTTSGVGFQVANINLDPETGVNVDVGARVRLDRFTGGVTYFNNTFQDFISPEFVGFSPTIGRGGEIAQPLNLSRVRYQGVEIDGEVPMELQGNLIHWFGNFSYLHGEILSGFDPRLAGQPTERTSPFKVIAGLRWSDRETRFWCEGSTRIQTHVHRVSPLEGGIDGSSLTPQLLFSHNGFTVFTLRGGYNLLADRYAVGLTLGVENVGNKYYREHFDFAPARGRSVTLGINLRYF